MCVCVYVCGLKLTIYDHFPYSELIYTYILYKLLSLLSQGYYSESEFDMIRQACTDSIHTHTHIVSWDTLRHITLNYRSKTDTNTVRTSWTHFILDRQQEHEKI